MRLANLLAYETKKQRAGVQSKELDNAGVRAWFAALPATIVVRLMA